MPGAAIFNAYARFVQKPTLALVAHQPTMRAIFELQSRLLYRSVGGVAAARAT